MDNNRFNLDLIIPHTSFYLTTDKKKPTVGIRFRETPNGGYVLGQDPVYNNSYIVKTPPMAIKYNKLQGDRFNDNPNAPLIHQVTLEITYPYEAETILFFNNMQKIRNMFAKFLFDNQALFNKRLSSVASAEDQIKSPIIDNKYVNLKSKALPDFDRQISDYEVGDIVSCIFKISPLILDTGITTLYLELYGVKMIKKNAYKSVERAQAFQQFLQEEMDIAEAEEQEEEQARKLKAKKGSIEIPLLDENDNMIQ